MKKIIHIVGARPNFMKAAPLIAALEKREGVEQLLVHTGQHYDRNMSEIFFDQLGIPKPDFNLDVGSASHAKQTAEIMVRFEEVALAEKPDLLVVYGDVNSTIGTAIVAAKLGIPIAHMEAGLRSFDRGMPEEINRILTDRITDLYLTPSADGDENLLREGVHKEKIHLVGNIMIDTLVRLLPDIAAPEGITTDEPYALVTLHRPSNVDLPEMLREIIDTLNRISERIRILFPIHPRTRARMESLDLAPANPERFQLLDPMGYLQFVYLQKHATLILTDSGGIQEESTYLQVPCLTLRPNTERPITCTVGTNQLIGEDMARFERETHEILDGNVKLGEIPPLWDGKTGERTADVLVNFLGL